MKDSRKVVDTSYVTVLLCVKDIVIVAFGIGTLTFDINTTKKFNTYRRYSSRHLIMNKISLIFFPLFVIFFTKQNYLCNEKQMYRLRKYTMNFLKNIFQKLSITESNVTTINQKCI